MPSSPSMCLDMTDRRHPFGQHGHYGKGWSVWPGASRSNGSPEPKTKGKAFPSCDRSWGPEPTITVVKEERAVANPGPEDPQAASIVQMFAIEAVGDVFNPTGGQPAAAESPVTPHINGHETGSLNLFQRRGNAALSSYGPQRILDAPQRRR